MDFASACPGIQEASATPASEPATRPNAWRRESLSSAIVLVISSNQLAIVNSLSI
ncbi:MAG TPA: hypothetical protein VFA09_23700 [Ktedonobacteraceae bacterium]|nr:hypothetical protein [Ktedonobacteraceae bacterium]